MEHSTLSYNLLHEPWIPVVSSSGKRSSVGIHEVLTRAHEFIRIDHPSPLVLPALTRVLTAILHRNFGPATSRDWERLFKAGCFDENALLIYMMNHEYEFDLFHSTRPFFQIPIVGEVEDKVIRPITNLFFENSSGNNDMLFSQIPDEDAPLLLPARVAIGLITYQYFSPSGTSTARAGEKDRYSKSAPLCNRMVFTLEGDNLHQTLMFNMIGYDRSSKTTPIPFLDTSEDLPCWEVGRTTHGERTPNGYLDYLTWQPRHIKLLPEADGRTSRCVIFGCGDQLPEKWEVRDPNTCYRVYKEKEPKKPKEGVVQRKTKRKAKVEFTPLKFGDRFLWRDASAIFTVNDTTNPCPAVINNIFRQCEHGVVPDETIFRVVASGLMCNKSKTTYWRQQRMSLPAAVLRSEEVLSRLRKGLDYAIEEEKRLRTAFRIATIELHKVRDPRPLDLKMVDYWTRLEPHFQQLLRDIVGEGHEEAISQWCRKCRATSIKTFDAGTSINYNSRSIKAVARGRQTLLPVRDKEVEELHPFVGKLLSESHKKGGVARLKRGATNEGRDRAEFMQLVIPLLEEGVDAERQLFVAAMFGLDPNNTNSGNMGKHLRQFSEANGNGASIENRFKVMLGSATEAQLRDAIRAVMPGLGTADVRINWTQLMEDLDHWEDPRWNVRLEWGMNFWKSAPQKTKKTEDVEKTTEEGND